MKYIQLFGFLLSIVQDASANFEACPSDECTQDETILLQSRATLHRSHPANEDDVDHALSILLGKWKTFEQSHRIDLTISGRINKALHEIESSWRDVHRTWNTQVGVKNQNVQLTANQKVKINDVWRLSLIQCIKAVAGFDRDLDCELLLSLAGLGLALLLCVALQYYAGKYKDVEEHSLPWLVVHKRHVLNFIVVSIWLLVGVCFGLWVEDWHAMTTFYVLMQIITTIGYGDVTVQSDAMHLFMAFYVLFGIAFVANIVNEMFNSMLLQHSEALAAKFNEISERLRDGTDSFVGELNLGSIEVEVPYSQLVSSFLIFAIFVLSGTAFYALYEDCSCSYGVTAVSGCKAEGFDLCTQTGGKQKDWSTAFYMSLITLTTVGFGDFSPQTWWGRAFALLWMFFGVLATGNLMSSISLCLSLAMQKERAGDMLSRRLFRKIDLDGSGDLDRYEFLTYMVMKENLVTQGQLDKLNDIFQYLDRNNSGTITYDEIEIAFSG